MAITSRIDVGNNQFTDATRVKVDSVIGSSNSASKFKADFNNEDGRNSSSFTVGDEVLVFADDTDNVHTYAFPYTFDFRLLNPLFTGIVEDINFTGSGRKEKVSIEGRDYTARLQDATVEPIVYNSTEVSVIVKDIIANNITGITVINVNATPITVNNIAFNHTPVFDALKQLAELANYIFYVDSSKDLHFEEESTKSSGVTLDGTNSESSTFKTSDSKLVNKVWVYGGRQLTGAQDVFVANGGSEYTLTYKPSNTEVFVAGGSVPKLGGIFNMVATGTGSAQYLVDFHNRNIIFTSGTQAGDNVPTSGDNIRVDYKRRVPIVKFGQDNASISSYGTHSKVIVDNNINEPQMATDIVKNELKLFKEPLKQGTVNVQGVFNLVASNTVVVNLPNQSIDSATFDILEANYLFTTKNNLHSRVLSVKVSKKLDDVLDTIKQMILDIKKLQAADIDTSDTITRFEQATGSFGIQVEEWFVRTRNINDAFVLGHSVNGLLGSPQIGTGSNQIELGEDNLTAYTVQVSGGEG